MIIALSDGKTGFIGYLTQTIPETRFHHLGKPNYQTLKTPRNLVSCANESTHNNLILQHKSASSRFLFSERNLVFFVKPMIIALSDGKTGFIGYLTQTIPETRFHHLGKQTSEH
jgi:hypothetical protein